MKASYNIVGVDLSLTSPGLACLTVYEDLSFKFNDFGNCKTNSDEPWFMRLNRVQKTVNHFIWEYKPKFVSVENYSYGSTNGREIAGEVHGVVLYKLFESGFPPERVFRDISPQARAKFFTGNGRATKPQVTKAVNEFFGFNFKMKENDIADACVLAYIRYCINHYTQLEPQLNTEQKKVINKILEKNNKPFGGN
jgi:crossover junction endodeoxyribonuclease RuvC